MTSGTCRGRGVRGLRQRLDRVDPQRAPGSVRLLRKFRRVDGRWFNDSETWDYTHRGTERGAQGPPGYASPREAFEARRKALAGTR